MSDKVKACHPNQPAEVGSTSAMADVDVDLSDVRQPTHNLLDIPLP